MKQVNINDIPISKYIDAVKKYGVYKVMILSRKKKKGMPGYKTGNPDVVVRNSSGKVSIISRRELLEQYRNKYNKKIKLIDLSSDKEYLLGKVENKKVVMLKVGKGFSVRLNSNEIVQSGDYIIIDTNENGEVDISTAYRMSPEMTKRTIEVPMSERLASILGINYTGGKHDDDIHRSMGVDSNASSPDSTISICERKENVNAKDLTAVYALTNINGDICGYCIKRNSDGMSRNVSINEMIALCKRSLVDNVEAVTNQNGNVYLRGNGIRIEDLPKRIVVQ